MPIAGRQASTGTVRPGATEHDPKGRAQCRGWAGRLEQVTEAGYAARRRKRRA